MKRGVVRAVILLVLVGVVGGAWWTSQRNPAWWSGARGRLDQVAGDLGLRAAETPGGLVASGFIEAEEVAVAADLGGRIVALHADEGDEVDGGQVLVELDDSLLQAQMGVAQADLGAAEATLALVEAGVRPETLVHAQAIVEQARAAQDVARVAWEDAQAMRAEPQDLELRLVQARARLGVLRRQEQQAQAMADSAQTRRDLADEVGRMIEDFEPYNMTIGPYEFRVKLPADMKIKARDEQQDATYQSWAMWTGLAQAEAARTGAEQYLAELQRQVADPLALTATANEAGSQYEIASSAVQVAQAQVDGLKIGATPEQVAAARAQVDLARAALEPLQVQVSKLRLKAPISGLVLERPVHVGELAVPGAPLMTLGNLDEVTLTIYVPEDQLGTIELGQPVSVTVDAYPGRVFVGSVRDIANEAEFTPKNVQTRDERVNMVFAVEVNIPNADHALKPGMPADALIQIGEG